MVIFGIDAHKRTHTVVVVDETGRQLACRTFTTTTAAHLELLRWAETVSEQRLWAVEDCRHVSRRLERDLLGVGERIVRVPPKLMADTRRAARHLWQVRPDRRVGYRPRRPSGTGPAHRPPRRPRTRGPSPRRPPR